MRAVTGHFVKLMNSIITSRDNGIVIIFYKDDYLLKTHIEMFVEGKDPDL